MGFNGGGYGGGAYCCTLNNCTLTGNSAWTLRRRGCDCTLNNCTLTGTRLFGTAAGPMVHAEQLHADRKLALYGGGGVTPSTLNNCTADW